MFVTLNNPSTADIGLLIPSSFAILPPRKNVSKNRLKLSSKVDKKEPIETDMVNRITKQLYRMLGCGKSKISSLGLIYSSQPQETVPIYKEVQRALRDASKDFEQPRK
jgi:hypothetical protein